MSPDQKQSPLTRLQISGLYELYSSGRLPEALASATAMVRQYSEEPILHSILGAIHAGLGQLEDAAASYEQALQIKPGVADAHFHLGNVLMELGRLDAATDNYERALRVKPDFVEAHSKLCQTLERSNQLEALAAALARAQQNCVGDYPSLRLREAELLKRRGDYQSARTLLEAGGEPVSDPDTLEARAYLLGDLCDLLGDTQAAFRYIAEANRRCQNSFAAQQVNGARYFELIENLSSCFNSDWISRWRVVEVNDGRPDPVFLVGFPRSGTTLLDTILRSHPGITVLEERPMVINLESAARLLPGGYPGGLVDLDSAQVMELRRSYFEELDKHVQPTALAGVVVDKLPLNMIHAGLIQRVFPRARFVFAQRHPCDCVLSCFMRAFKINEGMVNFLQLEDAARLYDRSLSLWQQYRSELPLVVHSVSYEQLIEDFEATLVPLLDFLGVEWDEALANYRETAGLRASIDTPSYNQVTQPLYTQARGRWEAYRTQMQPVLATLLPWAERLGYPAA